MLLAEDVEIYAFVKCRQEKELYEKLISVGEGIANDIELFRKCTTPTDREAEIHQCMTQNFLKLSDEAKYRQSTF